MEQRAPLLLAESPQTAPPVVVVGEQAGGKVEQRAPPQAVGLGKQEVEQTAAADHLEAQAHLKTQANLKEKLEPQVDLAESLEHTEGSTMS